MERHEFLKSLGLGVAMVCGGACLSACGGGDDTSTPNNPNPTPSPNPGTGNTVSIDIPSKLANVGDQTAMNGVLFFRMAAGNTSASFVTTEALCPHQNAMPTSPSRIYQQRNGHSRSTKLIRWHQNIKNLCHNYFGEYHYCNSGLERFNSSKRHLQCG